MPKYQRKAVDARFRGDEVEITDGRGVKSKMKKEDFLALFEVVPEETAKSAVTDEAEEITSSGRKKSKQEE